MGLLFIIIALIFDLNGATWFSGEDGVQTALYWIGGVLILLQVLWMLFVGGLFAASAKRVSRF